MQKSPAVAKYLSNQRERLFDIIINVKIKT
jgi:hypothetical protein